MLRRRFRPLAGILRFVAAPIGTVSLLLSPGLMRTLPWRYILGLIRGQKETSIAAGALLVSVVLTLIGCFYFPALALANLVILVGGGISQIGFVKATTKAQAATRRTTTLPTRATEQPELPDFWDAFPNPLRPRNKRRENRNIGTRSS